MEDESGGGVPIDNVDIISCLPDEILQRILSFFRTFLAIKKQKSTVMADESGGRVPIDNVDMISSLPDEILHRILSFLPTFLAIKTCVLSKRWRHIWRWIPSLSLLECDEESVESVDKTLYYHKAPKLLSFHLGFRFDMDLDFPGGPITHHTYFPTDSWIEFALSHQTQILSLDFILLNYKAYRFPDILYHNSSVKRLSLILHWYTTLLPASTVFWPSLHSLCLDGCNIPDKSAATILSGCPLLQSLTLTLCRMLVRLDLSKSTHLTRLDIVLGSRNSDSGPTQIVAPHIHSFSFKTCEIPCTLDDVPSLREAKVDVFQYRWWGSFHHVLDLKVLAKLHNIHKLTLGAMCLQTLSLAELRGLSFPMLNITALTLETEIFRYVVPGIARLLQNSPGLKKLTLRLLNCDIVEEKRLDTYTDSRGLEFGVSPTSSEPKLIASFIQFLLGNTNTLETLVVRLEDKLDPTRFEELLQMVPTLPHNHNVSILLRPGPMFPCKVE